MLGRPNSLVTLKFRRSGYFKAWQIRRPQMTSAPFRPLDFRLVKTWFLILHTHCSDTVRRLPLSLILLFLEVIRPNGFCLSLFLLRPINASHLQNRLQLRSIDDLLLQQEFRQLL